MKKAKNINPVNYKEISFGVANYSYDEDSKTVSGYLAVFGNKDSDGDIIIKGAFARSLKNRGVDSETNRKIAFCWQHDIKDPIGKFTVLKEDDFGLYFEAVLDDFDAVPNAKRTNSQLQSGTLNQFSIGFMYVWDKMEYDEEQDAFIIKELNLFEGSVVTMGANELTYFAGMKGDNIEEERLKLVKETEQFIKGLPHELQYNTRQLISKHIALAQAKSMKEEVKRNSQNQNALADGHSEPPVQLDENGDPQDQAFDLSKAISETTFFKQLNPQTDGTETV